MSHRTAVSLICDWPGCERGMRMDKSTEREARAEAAAEGWWRAVGLDFCPIHPRHQNDYILTREAVTGAAEPAITGATTLCLTCEWQDPESGRPGATERWLGHLTPIERGYDGTEHVETNKRLAREEA